LLLSILVL